MGWPKGRLNLAKRRPLADRYWEKVDRRGPDECWPFIGHITRCGYGRMWGDKGKNVSAHQVAMHLAGVPLPEGMEWDRKCKNRACQNPSHIRPMTHYDNSVLHSDSPHALNARKTHCKHGHSFTPENTAMYHGPQMRTATRVCLTCNPNYWRWAVVPRTPPAGARKPISKRLLSEPQREGKS